MIKAGRRLQGWAFYRPPIPSGPEVSDQNATIHNIRTCFPTAARATMQRLAAFQALR